MEKANKIPFFIDQDEVLINSISAFVQCYNEIYNDNADYTKLKQYNFKDICPLLKDGDVKDIFESDRFWELVTIKDGCIRVLEKYKDKFEYILCTLGTPKNLYKKSKFNAKNISIIEQMILLTNKYYNMDKSKVNMQGGIFLDDYQDNLFNSNAEYKICFKEKEYEWNKDWNGGTVSNWDELDNILGLIRKVT